MKVLLDTHTFLWFIAGNPRLSSTARQLIEEPTQSAIAGVLPVCGR